MTLVTEIYGSLVNVVTLSAFNLSKMGVMGVRVKFICFRCHLPVISMAPQADRHWNVLLRRVFYVAA